MIERVPIRPSSAPLPEVFSEDRCLQKVVSTLSAEKVQRLFSTSFQSILDEVKLFHPQAVEELLSSGCTQKRFIGPELKVEGKTVLKVRRTSCGVETHLYKPLQRGGAKRVFAVVSCPPGRVAVSAYAKSLFLRADRQRLAVEEASFLRAPADSELQAFLDERREEIAFIERQFRTEATVSSELSPVAIYARLVYQRKDPSKIKGLKMEYAEFGDLFRYLDRFGGTLSVSLLVRIASRVCSLVAKVHERCFFHGDIKSGNILLRKKPGGEVPLDSLALCDFSLARRLPSKRLCTQVEATFPAPEVFEVSDKNPVQYSFSQDLWALGITVFDIVYTKQMVRWNDFFHDEKTPWNWGRILGGRCWNSEPYVRVYRVAEGVNDVIGALLRINPAERLSAQKAAERLEAIASQMTSTATVS